MKKIEKCLPLEVCKDFRSHESESSFFSLMKKNLPQQFERADLLDLILTKKYMEEGQSAELRKVSYLAMSFIKKYMNEWRKSKREGNAYTEAIDSLTMADMILQWGIFKQVYKLDKDFLSELLHTRNLVVPAYSINHLPADDFYLDFSGAEDVYPVAGAFVHVVKGDSPQIAVMMLTDERIFFSYYSNLQYVEGLAEIPKEAVPMTPFLAYNFGDEENAPKNYDFDPRANIVRAIFQSIVFLAAENKDVEESPVSKKTYRKSSTVRDKFSEVRTWDVGVRYGKAIRIGRTAEAVSEEDTEEFQGDECGNPRKSPRPHVRSAHWHRYHVGKGRKEIRINWLAPSMVGGNKELPATIREVKKEEGK